MTKEEARIVWAAASEYRWRGFDHWWEEQPSRKPETIEWVKTSERLPESAANVLIQFGNESGIEIAQYGKSYPDQWEWTRYNHCCGDNTTIRAEDITHWQPLPEPPKEQEK